MKCCRLLIVLLLAQDASPVHATDTYSYSFRYYLSDRTGGLRTVSRITVFETIDDNSFTRMLVTHSPVPCQVLSAEVIEKITHDRIVLKRAHLDTPASNTCIRKFRPESSLITPSEFKPLQTERLNRFKGQFHHPTERIRRESHVASEVVTVIENDFMRVSAYQKGMPIHVNIPGPHHHLWQFVRDHLSIVNLTYLATTGAARFPGFRLHVIEKRTWTEARVRAIQEAYKASFLDFVFGLDCRYDINALVDKNLNIFALEIINQETGEPSGFLVLESVLYAQIRGGDRDSFSEENYGLEWLFKEEHSCLDQ